MKFKNISDAFTGVVEDSKQRLIGEFDYFTQKECNMNFSETLNQLKGKLDVRRTETPPTDNNNHDNMG